MADLNLKFERTLGRMENRVFYDTLKGEEVIDEITSVCFADVKVDMMSRDYFNNDSVTAVRYYPWLIDAGKFDLTGYAEQWIQFAMSIPFVKKRVLEYTGYTLNGHHSMQRGGINTDKYVLIDFTVPVDEAFVTAQLFRIPQECPGSIQLFARLLEQGVPEQEAWAVSLYFLDTSPHMRWDGHSVANGYDPVWWQEFFADPSIAVSKGNRFKSDVLGGIGRPETARTVPEVLSQLRSQDLPKHYVIVYGSLRKGMGNHSLLSSGLESGEVLDFGKQVTRLPAVMCDTGYGFPALIPSKEEKVCVVEQYKVNDEYLNRLDQLEGYPAMYNRAQVLINGQLSWVYYQLEKEPGYEAVNGDWVQYKRKVA